MRVVYGSSNGSSRGRVQPVNEYGHPLPFSTSGRQVPQWSTSGHLVYTQHPNRTSSSGRPRPRSAGAVRSSSHAVRATAPPPNGKPNWPRTFAQFQAAAAAVAGVNPPPTLDVNAQARHPSYASAAPARPYAKSSSSNPVYRASAVRPSSAGAVKYPASTAVAPTKNLSAWLNAPPPPQNTTTTTTTTTNNGGSSSSGQHSARTQPYYSTNEAAPPSQRPQRPSSAKAVSSRRGAGDGDGEGPPTSRREYAPAAQQHQPQRQDYSRPSGANSTALPPRAEYKPQVAVVNAQQPPRHDYTPTVRVVASAGVPPGAQAAARTAHAYYGCGLDEAPAVPNSAHAAAANRPNSASAERPKATHHHQRPISAHPTSRNASGPSGTGLQMREQGLLDNDDDDDGSESLAVPGGAGENVMLSGARTEAVPSGSKFSNNGSLSKTLDEASKEARQTTDGGGVDPEHREYLTRALVQSLTKRRGLPDFYTFGKVIGVGSFGTVRVARHKLTGVKVAIKTYERSKMKDAQQWKRVQQEARVMEKLSDSALVCRFFEAFDTPVPRRAHLVMELLPGGNLCSHVKQKRNLQETELRPIALQLALAVEHMHSLNVVHRDIKLENILFVDEARTLIRVIDFGFSTRCAPDRRLRLFCGTPSYMAPEIVRRTEYRGKPIDIWSTGVVIYACLGGHFPFAARSQQELYRKILRGAYRMPDGVSEGAASLVRGAITLDVARRTLAGDCVRHSWLANVHLPPQPLKTFARSKTPRDDLRRDPIHRLESLGIPRDSLVHQITHSEHTPVSACYYLLMGSTIKDHKPEDGNPTNKPNSDAQRYAHATAAAAAAAAAAPDVRVAAAAAAAAAASSSSRPTVARPTSAKGPSRSGSAAAKGIVRPSSAHPRGLPSQQVASG